MPATASDRAGALPGPSPGSTPAPSAAPRRFRWTVRLRLTLLYGALFLASGAALLIVTYVLVATRKPQIIRKTTSPGSTPWLPDDFGPVPDPGAQREAMLEQLLTQSGIALALMSAVSVALGWLMAGRALRPVRTMADKARRISERNLHERLAVGGPDDELKDLGDTIDGLLARLDTAFTTQKRFVANASHELRTPLTLQRAMIEVALANPAANAGSLRAVCERLLATGERQEHLIEALLTLARGQRGLQRREPVDLVALVAVVLHEQAPDDPRVERSLGPARTAGDPRLLESLVTNLVSNAVRHNVPGGWIRVHTGVSDGRPVLRMTNSGPEIPHERVEALFQPFQRFETRTGTPDGHGLGMSIVAAVADAHGAPVTAHPGPEGGLDITVTFGPADAAIAREPD
ncbi:sensor histidine kinase [Streptomyces aureoverticillatus]|uniref:sensor histidine kinase n=1 Tax=Streptomyces aureoverticillatus TaxID=66871 RepID=UPI0013D9DFD5|nr:ATP-binding protein [Streptomyces aureoverticillatus]QIB48195.1 HAMP domain-containing protein [Streptomyces aureoverticillatus]